MRSPNVRAVRLRALVFPAALLSLSACDLFTGGEGAPKVIDELPRPLSVAEADVRDAGNDFAFRFFRAVLDEQGPSGNVFVSPLSASYALGMTLNGAAGQTYQDMAATLGLQGMQLADVNKGYYDLTDLLLGLDPSVTLGIANSIWYDRDYTIAPSFLQDVRTSFRARVEAVDFTNRATLDLINGWVKDATRGRIPSILDELDPDEVMHLINAVYFKAAWTKRFDPAETRTMAFQAPGGPVQARMMNRKGGVWVGAGTSDASIVELRYGGGPYAMTLVLPHAGVSLERALAGFSRQTLRTATENMAEAGESLIFLPRFKLEYEAPLNDVLKGMGMAVAFTEVADFSRMRPERDLLITEVLQRTFVEVNEEGTEAAAVTRVTMGITSAPPSYVFDRPFAFFIRERLSGTILFAGRITDPTKEK